MNGWLVGLGALGLGGYALSRMHARHGQAQEERALARRRLDARRRRECDAVLRNFNSTRGYLAGHVAKGSDIRGWIDGGISPADLRAELDARAESITGPLLGYLDRDGEEIPVRLPDSLRARHQYQVGRTGTGKTTALRRMILQTSRRGTGSQLWRQRPR